MKDLIPLADLHPDQLLTDEQASEFLTTPKTTLSVWRTRKSVNLPYVKFGKNVRYRVKDLIAFMDANTVRG